MLKKTVRYKDFNDNPQVDDLYFHLSKSDMFDMMDIQPRIAKWQAKVDGPTRQLTEEEVLEFLAIVKILIQRSYGERSEDGKRFTKNERVFEEFKSSGAYDEFLFSLFENPQNALDFVSNIIPADLEERANAIITSNPTSDVVELPQPVQDDIPAWKREGRLPTQAEMRNMSAEEMREAFKEKTAQ